MSFVLPPVKSDAEMLAEVRTFAIAQQYSWIEQEGAILLQTPDYQVRLRLGSSDFHVYAELFLHQEYAPALAQYRAIRGDSVPNVILDIGANIGCSVLYWHSQFASPPSIIAVEAAPSNFEALAYNLQLNATPKHIHALHAALWTDNRLLDIDTGFRDGREWAFSARPSESNGMHTVQGITLEDICARYGLAEIDILKIDIEGGEAHILRHAPSLALMQARVGLLLMEIHEEAITMAEAKEYLRSSGFVCTVIGTLILAVAERWRAA